MPQMAPINWMILFMIFIMSFLLFNMMNYYMFATKMPNLKLNFNYKNFYNLNWKW